MWEKIKKSIQKDLGFIFYIYIFITLCILSVIVHRPYLIGVAFITFGPVIFAYLYQRLKKSQKTS